MAMHPDINYFTVDNPAECLDLINSAFKEQYPEPAEREEAERLILLQIENKFGLHYAPLVFRFWESDDHRLGFSVVDASTDEPNWY